MLPAKCGSTESGLIKLREPVFTLFLGKSSRRHARQNISIEPFEEIIHMGLLGPLHESKLIHTFTFLINLSFHPRKTDEALKILTKNLIIHVIRNGAQIN